MLSILDFKYLLNIHACKVPVVDPPLQSGISPTLSEIHLQCHFSRVFGETDLWDVEYVHGDGDTDWRGSSIWSNSSVIARIGQFLIFYKL